MCQNAMWLSAANFGALRSLKPDCEVIESCVVGPGFRPSPMWTYFENVNHHKISPLYLQHEEINWNYKFYVHKAVYLNMKCQNPVPVIQAPGRSYYGHIVKCIHS